jgi:hypothetical protein
MRAASENRKRLQRELADHLREKDRAALGLLRAKITAARVERRHRLHAARQTCHGALLALRERQREERHRLTLDHRALREQGRATCNSGKQQAREEGMSLEQQAQSEYYEERKFQRQMRRATKPRVERSTARERTQETMTPYAGICLLTLSRCSRGIGGPSRVQRVVVGQRRSSSGRKPTQAKCWRCSRPRPIARSKTC